MTEKSDLRKLKLKPGFIHLHSNNNYFAEEEGGEVSITPLEV